MQPLKSTIQLCLLFAIACYSCKKNGTSTTKTKTHLLSDKEWIYQAYYINNASTPLLYYQRDRATGN
jgi:hypothetical protein